MGAEPAHRAQPTRASRAGGEVVTDNKRKGDAIICAACPEFMVTARPGATWKLSQFTIGKELGAGFASVVYAATCRLTGHPCVLKVYKKNVHEVLEMQIGREISIHSSIKHPHAIDLYAAFEDEQNHYLILEYMPHGDLFAYLELRKKLDEPSTVRIVVEPMLQVLKSLHSEGIIHRDIKPENIMLSKQGGTEKIKLADFGLSIRFTEERPVSRVGTLDYMPPEVLACRDKVHVWENKNNFTMEYGIKADVWALGILAYESLFGWPPFSASDVNEMRSKLRKEVVGFPNTRVSDACKDFIRLCLTADPAQRPTCTELLLHPWVSGHANQLSHTPSFRGSVATSGLSLAHRDREPDSNGLTTSKSTGAVKSSAANSRSAAASKAPTTPGGAAAGGKEKRKSILARLKSRLWHSKDVAPDSLDNVEARMGNMKLENGRS
ncbi:unnamed protein product [Pedinophyceae sp. YPF-701]|nr:unnamed protein product [Pedinophyceae sp. YPF-701]